MDFFERVWELVMDTIVTNVDPTTVVATLLFAIPAIIVGWLMLYFER